MLKDTKYTRTVRALRNFVMMVLPLFFLALTGCRNEEDIPERLSGEDDVTVRLNLSTRGVTAGGSEMLDLYSSDPANWYKTGTLFPQAPAQPRIALMVFNKEQNRYVYSRLLPFSSGNAEGNIKPRYASPKARVNSMLSMPPTRQERTCPIIRPEESCRTRFHGTSSGKAWRRWTGRILSKPHSLPSSGSRMMAVSAFRWTTRMMV